MRRGDIVTVSAQGDYGKPRPAIVIQSDWLAGTDSVLVCLITSAIRDAPLYRLPIDPSAQNGLRVVSHVMVDKIIAMRRDKCGKPIGRVDESVLAALSRLLALAIGLADPPT